MSQFRRCSRPGCGKPAVATLTYAYSDSTAVVGPLAPAAEPHSWDLCEHHAERITAPLGWEMLRVNDITIDDDEDLTALAQAVREAGRTVSGLVPEDEVGANHPVNRSARIAERKVHRKGHLYVVPDSEDGKDIASSED
ncbi:DUF3499 domain-containing protein [Corynebacterium deserti]|uniref:DUF3499 domain-containing protein n=1 Tax=Corynebacterium deserti TaxID=1408191 RepID=UPI0012E250CF|nr:DUF3499 domain-containing protein [Corynebacterium deserti]